MQLKATDMCYTIIRIYNGTSGLFSLQFSSREAFLANGYCEIVSDCGYICFGHRMDICIWEFYLIFKIISLGLKEFSVIL